MRKVVSTLGSIRNGENREHQKNFGSRSIGFVPTRHPEESQYAILSQLATGYFMQDYDIFGDSPAEVLEYAKKELGPANAQRLKTEILKFLQAKQNLMDAEFAHEYKDIFHVDVELEGWEGKTTRRWLELFTNQLSES